MSIRVDNILPVGWLNAFSREHRRISIGIDPATTTKQKSNPTGIVVLQQVNQFRYARLVIRMKTEDPDVVRQLLGIIIDGLRSIGLSVRRICIRATNERFFAVALRKKLAGKVPVELLIESEKINYLGTRMLVKVYLGNLVVNAVEDGYLPVPDEEWLKRDFRSVVKEKGSFEAEILDDGGHGDVFDAGGAALHGIDGKGKPEAEAMPVGSFRAQQPSTRKLSPLAKPWGQKPSVRLT